LTVNGALTVLVPSDTTIVSGPPGSAGTARLTLNDPLAADVRQVVAPPVGIVVMLSDSGEVVLTPPYALANAPPQLLTVPSHEIVAVPEVVVISIGELLANPEPVMVRVEPTVPDVTEVSTGTAFVTVIEVRATAALAAWAGEAGSKNTIPATPARSSNPTVPNEASLLFGVICVCILFTYFRNSRVPE